MTTQAMKRALVIAITGATALGAVTPAWSAPVMTSTATITAAAPPLVSDVRYYRDYRGYRGNDGAAVALGVLGAVGAVAAASAYRHNGYGYYGHGGPYGYPGYYGHPYYGPANYGYYRGY